jgi:hypothetical protein
MHRSWVESKHYVYQYLMGDVAVYWISFVTYGTGLPGLKLHLSGRDTAGMF